MVDNHSGMMMPIVGGSKKACDQSCPYRRMVFRLLVLAQIVIAATIVLTHHPPLDGVAPFILSVGGIALGLWSIAAVGLKNLSISPEIREKAELVENGPYRLIRHPMYSALLLFAASFVVNRWTYYGTQLWLGLLITLVIKALYEESLLRQRFPTYGEYMTRTKRFIPYVI